jgi:PUA domain protein
MKLSGRRYLSSKERKIFLKQASLALNIELVQFYGEKPTVEEMSLKKNNKLYLINKVPTLIKTNEDIFLTLMAGVLLNRLPRVTVDMGAIPHICNGADIMLPGIVSVNGNFNSGAIVVIADEKYGKFIAVGKALISSDEIKSVKSGRIIKNIHFIGDDVWEFIKNMH